MSEYEIELVLEATPPVVGEANGFESALDSLDEASIRRWSSAPAWGGGRLCASDTKVTG
jgi:hypothetical protein